MAVVRDLDGPRPVRINGLGKRGGGGAGTMVTRSRYCGQCEAKEVHWLGVGSNSSEHCRAVGNPAARGNSRHKLEQRQRDVRGEVDGLLSSVMSKTCY